MWVDRARIKAHSLRLKVCYPFIEFGRKVSIHYTCELRRCHSHRIAIGDHVFLDREVWLNIPYLPDHDDPVLIIGNGANLGRRCIVAAGNSITIGNHVLFAPAVFITDHNHIYDDPTMPIMLQGITTCGSVVIGDNCWFGYGSMVLATRGPVTIGHNSVIGSYAVVNESCPPYSVLVGNPARVVKHWDPAAERWVRVRDAMGLETR